MIITLRRSTVYKCLIIIILIIITITLLNKQVLTTSGANRRLPIYSVQTDEKRIAISFDAAWGADSTSKIMDILDKYHIKTTFFLVGFWVDKYPDKVKEIHSRGHEIGNHSTTHPHMSQLSKEQIDLELNETGNKIRAITQKQPDLFRPPFGDYNNVLIETAEQNGYYTIQWDVDSLDWKQIGSIQIVDRVVRNVKNGSIVLFHNNSEYVLEYLPPILDKLTVEGYEIVPIGELILRDNYFMDHTGKQCKLNQE